MSSLITRIFDQFGWGSSFGNRLLIKPARTRSKKLVSHANAHRVAAVWSCTNHYCSLIASMERSLLRVATKRKGRTKFEVQPTSPLHNIVSFQFNNRLSANDGMKMLVDHYLNWGNAFAVKTYQDGLAPLWAPGRRMPDRYRPVSALYPIHPSRINPEEMVYDEITGEPIYRIYVDEMAQRKLGMREPYLNYRAQDMVHIQGACPELNSFDVPFGKGVIPYAAESIGISAAASDYIGAYFGNDTALGAIYSFDHSVSEDTRKDFEKQLAKLSGARNAHQFLVAGGGLKVERSIQHPDAARYIETQNLSKDDIATFYRVPLCMLNIRDYKSPDYSKEIVNWINMSVMPITKDIGTGLIRQCLRREHEAYKIFFDARQIQFQVDLEGWGRFIKDSSGVGLFSNGQYLDMLNMEADDEEISKIHFVASNMITTDHSIQLAELAKKRVENFDAMMMDSQGYDRSTGKLNDSKAPSDPGDNTDSTKQNNDNKGPAMSSEARTELGRHIQMAHLKLLRDASCIKPTDPMVIVPKLHAQTNMLLTFYGHDLQIDLPKIMSYTSAVTNSLSQKYPTQSSEEEREYLESLQFLTDSQPFIETLLQGFA